MGRIDLTNYEFNLNVLKKLVASLLNPKYKGLFIFFFFDRQLTLFTIRVIIPESIDLIYNSSYSDLVNKLF